MPFNSQSFILFFGLFYILFWATKDRKKVQQWIFFAACLFFYAYWDWRFLSLVLLQGLINYGLGFKVQNFSSTNKNPWLTIGVILNLGVLGFFKYFNFFIESFNAGLEQLGVEGNINSLQLIAPLGVSYYTFRSLSYLLDLDKGKCELVSKPITFLNYLLFFPSLMAGPIDKSRTIVPQLNQKKPWQLSQQRDGFHQILWGLFKKLVIADNCSPLVSEVYSNYETYPASMLALATLLYGIQLYADFSGYSDMALGFARLLGFEITKNFNFPYFATSIPEFWRRWHISLTAWLTEYVFTPLSIQFRNWGTWGTIAAILINFTLVGLWHGANWNCVLFGLVHGLYFIPAILSGRLFKKQKFKANHRLSRQEFFSMVKVFCVVTITFVIFRTDGLAEIFHFYGKLLSLSIFQAPIFDSIGLNASLLITIIFTALATLVEWKSRRSDHALQGALAGASFTKRWLWYSILFICIGMYGVTDQSSFIYAQF